MRFAGRLLSLVVFLAAFSAAHGRDWSDTIFDEKDRISSWRLRETGVTRDAFVYTNGIRFMSDKDLPFELKGHWQGDVFYSAESSGKEDVETATILADGSLRIHAINFTPSNTQDYILHKVVPGNPSDPVVVVPQPPDPGLKLAWPPPKGAITIGMTREDLEKLPWRRDTFEQLRDDPKAQVYIYSYHCDDPTLVDLTVTVKNGRVVLINGGSG